MDGSGALDKYEYVTAWNLWERCFAPKPCRSLPGKAFSEEQVTQQLMARNLKAVAFSCFFLDMSPLFIDFSHDIGPEHEKLL